MAIRFLSSQAIDGSLTLATIANATTDTDKFLVSDSGVVKYRTGAEVRSDIGAGTGDGNVTTGGFTSGRVPFANSSVNLDNSANLLWDDTNKQLNVRAKSTSLANQPAIPMLIDNAASIDGRVMLQIKTNDVSTASAQGAGITLTAPQNTTGTYDPVNSLIFLQSKSPGNQTIHSAPKNIKFYVDNDGTGAGAGTDYNAFGDLAFELFDSGVAKTYYELQVAGLVNAFGSITLGANAYGQLNLQDSGTSYGNLYKYGGEFWIQGAGTGNTITFGAPTAFVQNVRVNGLVNLNNLQVNGAQGTANQVLTSSGSGVSWATPSSGANDFLTALSFDTSTGVLTGTVSNQTDPTVDLDGRYFLSSGGTIGGAVTIEGNVFMDDYNITSVNQLDFGFTSGYIEGSGTNVNFLGLSVQIGTISNATTDTDKFLVSDSGVIKYRTGAELRSDIGAGTGSGTVTSVGITAGTGISVSGSPITSSGNITVTNSAPDTGTPAILSDGATPSLNSGITAAEVRSLIGAGTGSGTVTGTGSSGRIAFWNSSTNITSEADFLWSGQTLQLGSSANASEYSIEMGKGRTNNGYAYIDLVGDATYTDYGLRIIRNNSGANTSSEINHRGTGNFAITTLDDASFKIQTNGANERLKIRGNGEAYFGPDGASTSTLYIDTANRKVGFRTETPGSAFDVNGTFRARNELNIGATTEQNFFVSGSSPYYVKMGDYTPSNANNYMGGETVVGLVRSTAGLGSTGKVLMDTRYYTTQLTTSGWPTANGGSNGVQITPNVDSDQLMIVKSIYITRQGYYNTSSWGSDTYPVQFVQQDSQGVYQIIGAVANGVLTQSPGVSWSYEAYGNISELNNPQNERQGWLGNPLYLILSGTNLSNSKPVWFITVQYSLIDNDIRKANVDNTL